MGGGGSPDCCLLTQSGDYPTYPGSVRWNNIKRSSKTIPFKIMSKAGKKVAELLAGFPLELP